MRREAKIPEPLREFIFDPPVAPTIWPRRVFHVIAGSSIPVGVLFLPMALVQWLLIVFSIVAVTLEAGRAMMPPMNDLLLRWLPFFKPQERVQVTGATYLWISATIAVFAFDKDTAVLGLLFLAFGDPVAALVGGRDHRARIFGKSIAGSSAFVVAAIAAGAGASLHPDIPLAWWLVPGAVTAAIAELLPIPFDDNLSVPLAAAGIMALLAMI